MNIQKRVTTLATRFSFTTFRRFDKLSARTHHNKIKSAVTHSRLLIYISINQNYLIIFLGSSALSSSSLVSSSFSSTMS